MKHTYIEVKLEDYQKYYEKYNHNKLDKWNIIIPLGNNLPKFLKINEEIFEGRETEYIIEELLDSSYLLKFTSSNNNVYRFDLIKEPNVNIYHLAFSEYHNNLTSSLYEYLTNKGEAIDVFSRLIWILKDISPKINVGEYCIGGTFDYRKNKIYQYLMRFVSGWEKRNTNIYDVGWGLYFKI